MKTLRIACAAALLLVAAPLAACQTAPAGGTNAAVSGPLLGATLNDEKALRAVEKSYDVAATAYLDANRRGLLTPELKADLKPIFADAYMALVLARAAYQVGDAEGFAAQGKFVAEFAGAALKLIPK